MDLLECLALKDPRDLWELMEDLDPRAGLDLLVRLEIEELLVSPALLDLLVLEEQWELKEKEETLESLERKDLKDRMVCLVCLDLLDLGEKGENRVSLESLDLLVLAEDLATRVLLDLLVQWVLLVDQDCR